MITFPPNDPPAESYLNTRANPPCENLRWWVKNGLGVPVIMGGGSIVSAEDWAHLRRDFGITHVLNLDTKSDAEFVPADRLCEVAVTDNGMAIAAPLLAACCSFARSAVNSSADAKLYVHSGNGGARAPAIIYAIFRSAGESHENALRMVNRGFPHSTGYEWSYLDGHMCAIGSIDCWIDRGGLGA
jgi:hypothetical protein